MRVLGTQIDVAVLMGARALPEKPDPEAPLSSCFVVSKAEEQFCIRVSVSTTVPEPIMAAVTIDGQPLKHNYPIYRTRSNHPRVFRNKFSRGTTPPTHCSFSLQFACLPN
jgi:hypothetical protein